MEKKASALLNDTIDQEVDVLAMEIASEAIKTAMNLELQKRLDEDAIECASEDIVDEVIIVFINLLKVITNTSDHFLLDHRHGGKVWHSKSCQRGNGSC